MPKRHVRLVRSVLPLVGAVLTTTPTFAQATAQDTVTAFVHVAVVPMDRERVLRDQTVVVRGRHIVALGPATRTTVPAGAFPIDGRGKFLMPGLADMHNHREQAWFAFLASGVTTVRNPGGTPGAGKGALLRAQVAGARLPGPHVYGFGTASAGSPAEAVHNVLSIKAAGDEAIKLEGPQQPEVYNSILATARRVHLPLVGHVPLVPLEAVLRSGQWRSIEHLTGYLESVIGVGGRWTYDGRVQELDFRSLADTAAWMRPTFDPRPRIRALAQATRKAGVWNCPTLGSDFVQLLGLSDAELQGMVGAAAAVPAARAVALRFYELELDMTKALQDAGAGLLLGSDGGLFAVNRELQLLVQAGLTPYQALASGTRNAATFLGTLDSSGTVAVGKLADLVLLDANPLTDVRHTTRLAGVMAGGQWYPRAELDRRLDSLGLKAQRDAAWQQPVPDFRPHRSR